MLDKYKTWFENNPKGLTEYVIPFGTTKKIQIPISITKENIINHRETFIKYLTKLEEGILPEYYTNKIEQYIEEYDRLK